ncbi:MAG: thioredoxin family protein [Rhodothermia bacterium]|nr:thioredoxin family protein [Rhodothermia bacterium]
MTKRRKIEVFRAGCPVCDHTVERVRALACPSCEVEILDLRDGAVAKRAKEFGIQSVPAVVINGVVSDCCAGRGPNISTLKAMGLGQAIVG